MHTVPSHTLPIYHHATHLPAAPHTSSSPSSGAQCGGRILGVLSKLLWGERGRERIVYIACMRCNTIIMVVDIRAQRGGENTTSSLPVTKLDFVLFFVVVVFIAFGE